MMNLIRNLWNILNRRHKNLFWLVAVLAILMSLTEMIGLGVIGGFVTLVFNGNLTGLPSPLIKLLKTLSNMTGLKQLTLTGSLVLAIYVLRNAIYFVGTWVQTRYVQAVRHDLANRLLQYYMQQDYHYFLRHHSSTFINKIYVDIDRLATAGLQQLLLLLTDGLLIAGLTAFLLWNGGQKALYGIVGFVILSTLLYFPVRYYSKKYGERLSQSAQDSIAALRQIFDGIKVVKANNAESYFAEYFKQGSNELSRSRVGSAITSLIARPTIELAGISLVVFGLLWADSQGRELSLAGTAAMVVMAGYRLMPTLPRIISGISAIHSVEHIVTEQVSILHPSQSDSRSINKSFELKKQIEVKDLSFKYAPEENYVYQNFNLKLKP
ncbi:MAG: ABC transporter transmembrane domain-containing protein, partial [bacterium]